MIGILAGMGPKSTGPFVDLVVSEYQIMTGAKHDIDFPPMMIYSLPTPFYLDRPIDHKLMEKTLCTGLKKIESCGVSFVAMPCVTAHLYYEALQECIHVPLINMVNVTLEALFSVRKIALLATRPTIESQIFQKKLSEKGLEYVVPSQDKVDQMILNIKTGSDFKVLLDLWQELSSDFLSKGVDTIMLSCTDLNVFFQHVTAPFQIVDSSLCLARAVVKLYRSMI